MKRQLFQLLYACGLAGRYHRYRNRRVLTVVAFHRVIAATDARWQTCDPLYAISDRFFEQCLAFLTRHYSVVTLADLHRARTSTQGLPDRPLLITFDDGWADNYDYALPVLQRLRLPAVLFVASDALNRHEAFFQERIIGAWRARRLSDHALRLAWTQLPGVAPPPDLKSEAAIRGLIANLQSLPVARRDAVLALLAHELVDGCRQMLTTQELQGVAAANVAIGTHGKRHEALTVVSDVDAELHDSKVSVAAALGKSSDAIDSLSFPFSKQNAAVLERARLMGYRLLFDGGASLTPLDATLPGLVARVPITARNVEDATGNLVAHALAAYLFRRPHRASVAG